MLLAIDIGNSSIKFGVFDQDHLSSKFSISTSRDYSPGEIANAIGDRLSLTIDAVIVSSVVPEINSAVSEYIEQNFSVKPRFVKASDDFGLTFRFALDTIGTDRLVNSFAAVEKYGAPCIVVSFGTATTFDVVNRDREHLGGLIAPGMKVTAKALSLAASQLPEIELVKPKHVIATTTGTAIQSGIFFGHVAMLEGLLSRIKSELAGSSEVPGNYDTKVIATGGFADLIAPESDAIDHVDHDLTLEGLRMLFQ